jgi:predicted O-methyltransferase YrrM
MACGEAARSAAYNFPVITPPAIVTYLASLRRVPHPELDVVAAESAGIPIVDPQTGALLHALVAAKPSARVLEIGTAIGYSALWMATALPADGRLITLERDAARAETARLHFAAAGLADRVTVMIGDATRYLHKLAGPFDLIFQDGDKASYAPLLDRLTALLAPGGMLVTDDVLWSGELVPGYVEAPGRSPEDARAIAAYNVRLGADDRFFTVILPVGDGVAISTKR